MRLRTRFLATVIAALAIGLALMAHDRARDVGWAVAPAAADAKPSG